MNDNDIQRIVDDLRRNADLRELRRLAAKYPNQPLTMDDSPTSDARFLGITVDEYLHGGHPKEVQ